MEKKNYFNVFNVFFMLMLVLFGCESVSYDDTSTPKNNNEKKKGEYSGLETRFGFKISDITAADVMDMIEKLPNNGDEHEICVTGEISIDTLKQIGKILSENSNIAKIYLDLSKTTKPESIDDFVIDGSVFNNCTSLIGIALSADVTGISNDAFAGCTNLVSLRIDENNKKYKSFENCIFSKDGKTLVVVAYGLKSMTIPSDLIERFD